MQDPIQILVIDDEPVICDGCRLILSENGYEVDTRASGREGLRAFERKNYDILLLDMKLPDMDGMDILRKLHREKPDLQILVMTGYSTVSNAVKAMKLGAHDYLSKPYTDEELEIAVRKAAETKRLKEENVHLRSQLFERYDFNNIIGENARILEIFEQVRKVAPTDTTVLLEGESGTGKELFARALHAHSRRASRQFVAADCSTFSASLMESELFGHVRGAFTGAVSNKAGIFEAANAGTLFLDEIANLNLEIQAKLLRVMETGEFKPVGADRSRNTNTRIIAATNQNLKTLVERQQFREDLFYRLNVMPIYLPPLRDRKNDIPKLAYHFLRLFCRKMGKRIQGFSDDALELLIHHSWPGNVRQLKNVVERLVIMAEQDYLDFWDLYDHIQKKQPGRSALVPRTSNELKEAKQQILAEAYNPVEKSFLLQALAASEGNITRAAERVGMQRSNFSALMKKHDIKSQTGQ